MKIIGDLFLQAVCYFAVRYFPTIVSLFGVGAAPFFTAPAPAPVPASAPAPHPW